MLVPEALERDAEVSAGLLRARLPLVLLAAEERQARVYQGRGDSAESRAVLKSFVDFVELCERKQRETGRPCRISVRR
jgi:hypothetical protein